MFELKSIAILDCAFTDVTIKVTINIRAIFPIEDYTNECFDSEISNPNGEIYCSDE